MEKELFDSLVIHAPVLLVAMGPDGRILLINDALLEAIGRGREEIVGQEALASFIPEADHDALSAIFAVIGTKSARDKAVTGLITKRGEQMWVEWHGRTVRDSNDAIKAFFCIGIDVTQRLNAEEELIQTKEYLENVLESSPDAIGIVDAKGRFIKWNRQAMDLYGYTLSELHGKAAFDLYAEPTELARMLAKLRTEGCVKNFEIGMKRKDGTVLPFDVSISLLRNRSDAVVGSVCVARNLSEIKATLHDLEMANARLQAEIDERRRTWEALNKSQNEYHAIFENTGNATVIIEENTTISLANAEFAKLSGYSKEDIEGKKSWTEFFTEESLVWMKEYHRLRRIDPHAAPRNYEACFRNSQHELRDVYVTVAAIPETKKSVASFLDITERKRAEENLRQSHKELEQRSYEISQLNEMLDLLQVCSVREETYYIISHYLQKLFPADSGFLGLFKDSRSVLEIALTWGGHTPDRDGLSYDDCWGLRQGKVHAVVEPNGGVLCRHVQAASPLNYLCVPMIAQGEVMGLFHLRCGALEGAHSGDTLRRGVDSRQRLAVAVTDHIALALANLNLRETLRSQSIRDPLTGLFNRRFMEESLDREISRAKRHGLPVAIIMMDIDHFKQFNDSHGHDAGDLLLAELGTLLKNFVRGEDFPCRYGGEEFIVILPGASKDIAASRAENFRNQVKKIKVYAQDQEIGPVSVSLGVALYDEHGLTAADVLKAADMALYRAKNQGRDRMVMAS